MIAFIAIPADIAMIYYLKDNKDNMTSRLLRLFFWCIFLSSSINVLYYILRDFDIIPSFPFAGIRSLIANASITTIAWAFVYFIFKLHRKEGK